MFPNTKLNGSHGKEAVVLDKNDQCASKDEWGQVYGEYGEGDDKAMDWTAAGDNQEVGRTLPLHTDMQDSSERGMLLRYVFGYAANQSKHS